ncbi:helix-turn-helix domain-containing protein [Reyranella sp.]|uniref:helix-turn-helix domain-containing protein n=1 Tax=Reyranella sp. TaxID=1929291 RepID=UPI0011F9A2EA|nr:helix-turn-helix domain-containing protein [Reyranella sp.]TAJ90846.1 MAG: cyclic nucleotide-binding domain-containing protein [Reyranella sp.]
MQTLANVIRMPTPLVVRGAASAGVLEVLRKGEELFAEGDAADWFYKVMTGAIRTSKLLSDGRRQIGAFHLAGEIFGLEAGEVHRFTAEALAGATVLAFRRTCLELSAHDSEALREEVLASAIRSLDRAQEHMLLLGRKTAQEKVAAFLLDMADRMLDGEGPFELPMSRSDIADYLGLTIETVSRTLSQFTRDSLIRLPAASRWIELCNLHALRQLNVS